VDCVDSGGAGSRDNRWKLEASFLGGGTESSSSEELEEEWDKCGSELLGCLREGRLWDIIAGIEGGLSRRFWRGHFTFVSVIAMIGVGYSRRYYHVVSLIRRPARVGTAMQLRSIAHSDLCIADVPLNARDDEHYR
jgi:hypothetical protein